MCLWKPYLIVLVCFDLREESKILGNRLVECNECHSHYHQVRWFSFHYYLQNSTNFMAFKKNSNIKISLNVQWFSFIPIWRFYIFFQNIYGWENSIKVARFIFYYIFYFRDVTRQEYQIKMQTTHGMCGIVHSAQRKWRKWWELFMFQGGHV